MQPVKYNADQAETIDQTTKVIHKYPSPTNEIDIAKMVVNGRHPQEAECFAVEDDYSFFMYILTGAGKVYAGDETFAVTTGDVVFIPKGSKFAVDGDGLEYITCGTPVWRPEQMREVKG